MSELPRWHWDDPVEPLRQCLAAGGILAIPTESSYALAVDPTSAEGVEAVYQVKARERGKPLLVLVAEIEQAVKLGVPVNSPELEILADLWPAPLTAILPIADNLPASAGSATLAIRIPSHPRIRQLLRDVECALTATSANRSGEPPVLEPQALETLLQGRNAVLVDGGQLPGGAPSTLVQWIEGCPKVLRAGAYDPNLLPNLPYSTQHSPNQPRLNHPGSPQSSRLTK